MLTRLLWSKNVYFMYDVFCSGILRVEVQFVVLIFEIYDQRYHVRRICRMQLSYFVNTFSMHSPQPKNCL